MDSFEWNKIVGAVLFALLAAVGLRIFSEIIFEAEEPESPGYVIATAQEGEAGGGEAAEAQPIAVLLASADANAGTNAAKKCLACHTFGEGEPNKVGPNLWGVVMHPIASHEGYDYSQPMHAYAEQAETWTYEHLNTYLADPAGTVPQTKMAFPGLKDDGERANVIAYLRTLSADPEPLPEPPAAEPEAAEAPEGAEPAEGAAPVEEQQAAAEPSSEPQAAESQETQEPTSEEQVAATGAAAPAAEGQTAAAEMPAGDPAKGEAFAKRCTVCHTFAAGGPKKVGPPLFGLFDRPIAALPDYAYSESMVAFSEGGAKHWDAATLDSYLADPKGVVPGTKMLFPGVKGEEDRTNLIAYLATLNE
jgi:cytochrome c2